MTTLEPDQECIDTLRFLSVDAVQKTNSGHPGMPLGAAPMAYVLWTRFLKHHPANPAWFDRDRFVLSAGYGSMLRYSLLHLTGYQLSLEQIRHFRQWGSRTPGHPERDLTLDRTGFARADGLRRGAYVLADPPGGRPQIIIVASGSEIDLIIAAQHKLQEQQVRARVVSMPSWELFDAQSQEYRNQVLLPSLHARLAVEAGVSQGWHRYVGEQGDVLSVERFGASAPGDVVMREYAFTAENVCSRALALPQ